MIKRVICIIISVSTALTLFTGCNNLLKDYDKTEEYSVYSEDVETEENITWPSFIIENVSVSSDSSEASVIVSVQNNPGIAGALLRIYYDDRLSLESAQPGEAFSDLDYMPPGKFETPCNFSWDSESAVATSDGAILLLKFSLPEKLESRDSFVIRCSFRDEDIYDENLNNVAIGKAEGKIIVE